MKAFADQRKAKPVFRRHAPVVRVDQAGRPRTAQRAQVREILDSSRPQFKLTIGKPNDVYEQEADRVADEVMRMPEPQLTRHETAGTQAEDDRIQRLCPECDEELQRQPVEEEDVEELQRQPIAEEEEEEESLQTKETPGHTPEVTPELASNINALRGGGQPPSLATRAFFEPRFGHDFSQVRIHTGSSAAETAANLRARAFTVGRDVVFGGEQYAPDTSSGKRLLAHELTHVVQQGGREGPIQRQHTPDTGWRYTPPATVTRSIKEIQGVVGTTPDGVYGIDTKKAVIKYQTVLTGKGFYTDTIEGKWGNNTDVAHEAFATGSNVERAGYNCSGFAFKRFTWIDMAPTKAIYAAMTQLANCPDDCPAFHHKFWMWEFDINTEDTRTGATSATWRDFHTVGGQTDKDGKGPNKVMSKDGPRPVVGPRPSLGWRPITEPVVRIDGSQHPFLVWNVWNVDQECFCNQTLP